MNKKERKFIKRSFLKIKKAFSLIELVISMLVIAIIIAALTPVISKRLTGSSTLKSRISDKCDALYPSGLCALCYLTPKQCIICAANCADYQYKNSDDCKCESCATKYNEPHCRRCNAERCTRCESGYYLDTNAHCVLCEAGYRCYIGDDGKNHKEACLAGTYSTAGSSTCTKCSASYATTTGTYAATSLSTSCTACGNGKYAATEGATSCTNCPKGYYCPDGKKVPCPKGTAGTAEGLSNVNQCTKCVASTSTVVGTYTSSDGQTSCTKCGTTKYAASAGATTCSSCNPGHYCKDGKYTACAKGTATASWNATECIGCTKSTTTAIGNVATSTGLTSCTNCGDGTYAEVNKQTYACKACPAGNICKNGTIWNCSGGGGTVKGNYCYKKANSCSGAYNSKTWVSATTAQTKEIGVQSMFNLRTECTATTKYGVCTNYRTICTVRTTAGTEVTQYSGCSANQMLCVISL